MQVRFLSLERDGIFLLGYKLKLSPTEERLLRAIAEGGKTDINHLSSILPEGVSRGNVAVHINAINRKAEKLSQRKLVIYKDSRYELNPFM